MSERAGGLKIREGPRVPFEGAVWLRVDDWEDDSSYRTENLSPTGVMLRGKKPLLVEGPVTFRFEAPQATLRGEGTVEWVRRARSRGEAEYALGFSFLEVSEDSASAIERLLSDREAPRASVSTPIVDRARVETLDEPAGPFLDSLQQAERQRSERLGPDAALVDVVATPYEPRKQGSRSGLGSILGGIGAAVVAGGAAWLVFRDIGQEPARPQITPLSEVAPVSSTLEIGVAPSLRTSPPAPPAQAEGESAPLREAPAENKKPARLLGNDGAGSIARQILSVETSSLPSGTGVRLQADAPFAESSVSTLVLGGDAPRFVLKIADLAAPPDKDSLVLETSEAYRMRGGWHETERGGELHLVFDLTSSDIRSTIEVSGSELLVRLETPE